MNRVAFAVPAAATCRTPYHVGLWVLLALLVVTACSPGAEPGAGPSAEPAVQPSDRELPQQSELEPPAKSTPGGAPARTRDGGQKPGQAGQGQDQPPKQTLEVIQVDLNAIEPDPKVFKAAQLCPGLAGPLPQLITDTDPVARAQALGLEVRGAQVQVTLVLDRPDAAFLRQTGIEVGKQSGNEVQAFVPLSQLCELANHKRIVAIYPASQAVAQ